MTGRLSIQSPFLFRLPFSSFGKHLQKTNEIQNWIKSLIENGITFKRRNISNISQIFQLNWLWQNCDDKWLHTCAISIYTTTPKNNTTFSARVGWLKIDSKFSLCLNKCVLRVRGGIKNIPLPVFGACSTVCLHIIIMGAQNSWKST